MRGGNCGEGKERERSTRPTQGCCEVHSRDEQPKIPAFGDAFRLLGRDGINLS